MRYLLVLLGPLLATPLYAADAAVREGYWGGVAIGFGSLRLQPEVAAARSSTRLYLGLAGGYTLHPQLQLGIEASGWSIRSGKLLDPAKGESLLQLFGVVRYWPTATSNLFIKVAGGGVIHRNNEPGVDNSAGRGYTLGLGYELTRYAATTTHWFLNYSAGRIDDYRPPEGGTQGEDYAAVTTGLTLGF